MTAGLFTEATGAVVPGQICQVCGVTDVELLELGDESTWCWVRPDLCSHCSESEQPSAADRGTPWEELAKVCAADPGVELAPLVDDNGSRAGRLFPWIPTADVYALLGWIGRLEYEPLISARSVPGGTQLSVVGRLDGAGVELVALTHRPVAGAPGPVGLGALIDVARVELQQSGRRLP